MLDVKNDLPKLDSPYDVPADRVAEYRERGHTVLRAVASTDEIAAYRPVIKSVALGQNREHRPLKDRDTYGKAFLQMWNLWAVDDAVRRFTCAERFAQVAADLMGVDAVRIYHDQAVFKEGGGGPTPWHQDQFYWPLDSDNMITMWMPLVDVPVEVGTMRFVSGSQRLGYLGDYAISDESDATFAAMIEERGLEVDNHGAARAGDATFHAGWVLHSAPQNPTTDMREVMTVIYFADGIRIMPEPDNKNRWNDLEAWLPGVQPGGLAASPLNPLLYTAHE